MLGGVNCSVTGRERWKAHGGGGWGVGRVIHRKWHHVFVHQLKEGTLWGFYPPPPPKCLLRLLRWSTNWNQLFQWRRTASPTFLGKLCREMQNYLIIIKKKISARPNEQIWTWIVRFAEVMLHSPWGVLINIQHNMHTPLSRNVTGAQKKKKHIGSSLWKLLCLRFLLCLGTEIWSIGIKDLCLLRNNTFLLRTVEF